jgi:ribonuclease Z
MFKQVQPRLAMATHLAYDEETVPEMVAGVREHWDGLFQFGAPDVVVVNVTKNAIWTRKAALPRAANFARLSRQEAIELFDLSITKPTIDFPNPRHTYSDIESPVQRNVEFDAKDWYPPSVYRNPNPIWPQNFND